MAKISLNKLAPIKRAENKSITIQEQEVSIVQYLPSEEKGKLIQAVLDSAIDATGFYSPIRLDIMFHIEVIRYYTNISITEKMMEEPNKVYDLLILNGILDKVLAEIPEDEYETLVATVEECADQVSNYATSFAGTLNAAQSDFSITSDNINKMMETLHDPEAIGLVQDVLQKLG